MHSDRPRTATAAQSTESASVSRVNAFYTLGHYKDFRLLWIGNVFSMGAQWLQVLSIGWLVLKLTEGNALLTGMSVGMRSIAWHHRPTGLGSRWDFSGTPSACTGSGTPLTGARR